MNDLDALITWFQARAERIVEEQDRKARAEALQQPG